MNRILIIQTAFLGDVILATPVISEIKRIYPEAKIDILVKKGNESLLANNPKLNYVHTLDKSKGKWKSLFEIISRFRKENYDVVINLHRFGSSGLITGLSGAKKRYGFKKNPFSFLFTKSFPHNIGDGTHEVERNLSIIQEFGALRFKRPELFPSSEDLKKTNELKKKEYICIAPASVWYTKQLPKHKWVELINIIGKDMVVYLIGGKEDKVLCESIIGASKVSNIIDLSGKLSLLQSAALMKNAARNYVNDSGPMHIASAMNAKVTVFFCSTVEAFGFGPLSDDSIVKQVDNLDCRPCGLHGHSKCPMGHFNCGELIEIN